MACEATSWLLGLPLPRLAAGAAGSCFSAAFNSSQSLWSCLGQVAFLRASCVLWGGGWSPLSLSSLPWPGAVDLSPLPALCRAPLPSRALLPGLSSSLPPVTLTPRGSTEVPEPQGGRRGEEVSRQAGHVFVEFRNYGPGGQSAVPVPRVVPCVLDTSTWGLLTSSLSLGVTSVLEPQ